MIFVIGDIHGYLDPLRVLIDRLRECCAERKISPSEAKLIFLGDYIDHGPSSKQVIDYICSLEFQKVFLLGNHEAMMLDMLTQNYVFQRFHNNWFKNGGNIAAASFLSSRRHQEIIELQKNNILRYNSLDRLPREIKNLPTRYMEFLKNLKPSHLEIVNCADGQKLRLLFTHALPVSALDLDIQLSWLNYEDVYNFYERQKELFIDQSLIWSRKLPTEKIPDTLIIHGHNPTQMICVEAEGDKIGSYDHNSHLPFFYFANPPESVRRVSYANIIEFCGKGLSDTIAINLDTGSVYGHRLTAMIIPEIFCEKGEIEFMQIDPSQGFRKNDSCLHLCTKFLRED
jgi:hypothetical protein